MLSKWWVFWGEKLEFDVGNLCVPNLFYSPKPNILCWLESFFENLKDPTVWNDSLLTWDCFMLTTFDSVIFFRERPSLILYLTETWEFLGWIYEYFSSYRSNVSFAWVYVSILSFSFLLITKDSIKPVLQAFQTVPIRLFYDFFFMSSFTSIFNFWVSKGYNFFIAS